MFNKRIVDPLGTCGYILLHSDGQTQFVDIMYFMCSVQETPVTRSYGKELPKLSDLPTHTPKIPSPEYHPSASDWRHSHSSQPSFFALPGRSPPDARGSFDLLIFP